VHKDNTRKQLNGVRLREAVRIFLNPVAFRGAEIWFFESRNLVFLGGGMEGRQKQNFNSVLQPFGKESFFIIASFCDESRNCMEP
jgi:hypothetical protein